MDFIRLEQLAENYMKNRRFQKYREPGCVYYHGQRVAKGVVQLRRLVTDNDSHDDILRCAALFHDIAKGMKPHSHFGALLTRDILKDELTPYEMDEVCRLIQAHGDRRPAKEFHDMWVWLIQDADVLDHVGACGIWLSTNHSAYRQKPVSDLVDWYESGFDAEIEKYRERLNLTVSEAILNSKADFERQFMRRLIVESTGEYCPEDIPEAGKLLNM